MVAITSVASRADSMSVTAGLQSTDRLDDGAGEYAARGNETQKRNISEPSGRIGTSEPLFIRPIAAGGNVTHVGVPAELVRRLWPGARAQLDETLWD